MLKHQIIFCLLLLSQPILAGQISYTTNTTAGAYMPWTNTLVFPQFNVPNARLDRVDCSITANASLYVNVRNPSPPNDYVTAVSTNLVYISNPSGSSLATLSISNYGAAVAFYNQSKSILVSASTNTTTSVPAGEMSSFVGNGTVALTAAAPRAAIAVYHTYSSVLSQQTWGDVTMTLTYTYTPISPPAVAVWGNAYGTTPADLTNVAAIGAGWYHSFARRGDGSAVLWGNNNNNDTVIPNGVTDLVSMAGGQGHTIVLHGNGTVDAWGDDAYGQCSLQAGLGNIVAVAAGTFNSYVLSSSGYVYGWGDDTYGQVSQAFSLYNVISLSSLVNHGLALLANGSVAGFGDNAYGQTDIPPGLGKVVAVAAGNGDSMALRADGTVVVWGNNSNGQTNVPPGLSNVVAIAAGFYHCLALRQDGTVAAWGWNNNGQTNVPSGLSNVVAIAAGGYQSIALVGSGLAAPSVQAINAHFGGSAFSTQAATVRGKTYYLQHRDALSDLWWTPSLPVPGDGPIKMFSDSGTLPAQRFYRIWQKP